MFVSFLQLKTFSSNLFQSSVERIYNDANKNISSTNAGQRCWKKLNDLKIEQVVLKENSTSIVTRIDRGIKDFFTIKNIEFLCSAGSDFKFQYVRIYRV